MSLLDAIVAGYRAYQAQESQKSFFSQETISPATATFIEALNSNGIASVAAQSAGSNDKQITDIIIALLKYYLSGGGPLYGLIKVELFKQSQHLQGASSASSSSKPSATKTKNPASYKVPEMYQDSFFSAITRELTQAFESGKHFSAQDVQQLLELLEGFDGVDNKVFETDPKIYDPKTKLITALARYLHKGGDAKVLNFGIVKKALDTFDSVKSLIQTLSTYTPAIVSSDFFDIWLMLLKNKLLKPGNKISDQTVISFWSDSQLNSMLRNQALNTHDAVSQSVQFFSDLLDNNTFKSIDPVTQAAILSLPYASLSLKTPLQQLAFAYVTLSSNVKYQSQLSKIKDLILKLIALPVSINNETTPLWIEILLNIDGQTFAEIYSNIPDAMLNEFREKDLHTRLANQLGNPWILTDQQKTIARMWCHLIEKINATEANAQQITTVETYIAEETKMQERAASNTRTLINAIVNVIKLTGDEQTDMGAYQAVASRLKTQTFQTHESAYTQTIYGSIRRTLVLLAKPDSLLHTNPYAMVGRFVLMMDSVQEVFNRTNLTTMALMNNDVATQTLLGHVFVILLLAADINQTNQLLNSHFYKNITNKNSGTLGKIIGVDQMLRPDNNSGSAHTESPQTVQNFALKFYEAANDYKSSWGARAKTAGGHNQPNMGCATFISDVFSQSGVTNEKVEHAELCIAKSLLRIIDYRISAHKEGGKPDKKFYIEYLHPIIEKYLSIDIVVKLHHSDLFVMQISSSLKKLMPINYSDLDRVTSLLRSLSFLIDKLGLNLNYFEPSVRTIFNQLTLATFIPKNDNVPQANDSRSQETLCIEHFLHHVIQRATQYQNNLWTLYVAKDAESIQCAAVLASLPYNISLKNDDKVKLCLKAIRTIMSYRILSYKNDIYDKALYCAHGGFRDQLLLLNVNFQRYNPIILAELKQILLAVKDQQDLTRLASLGDDLQLLTSVLKFTTAEIEPILIECDFAGLIQQVTAVRKNSK